MTWGCQAGVEIANLITVMKNYKIINTESYESIKLGIDAHAKWYYVARQLDVDLWRVFTGQTTAENLGLVYLPDAA
jgi:hypothetical protein